MCFINLFSLVSVRLLSFESFLSKTWMWRRGFPGSRSLASVKEVKTIGLGVRSHTCLFSCLVGQSPWLYHSHDQHTASKTVPCLLSVLRKYSEPPNCPPAASPPCQSRNQSVSFRKSSHQASRFLLKTQKSLLSAFGIKNQIAPMT